MSPGENDSLSAVRRSLLAELKAAGIENHFQEADLMLIHLLNCTRAEILAHPEKKIKPREQILLREYAKRRARGEPLQYILNEAFFWGRPFEVGKGVLIPRPETELLAELALEFLNSVEPCSFLDWGTGSGCIAITLLLERLDARGFMAEKNPLSVSTAWKNLKRHGVFERAFLWHSRVPEDLPVSRGGLDLVVSNPPYIPTRNIPALMLEVRDHEPHLALDGGEDGMDCYRALFRSAPLWLKRGGTLLLEIGDEVQSARLREKTPSGFEYAKEARDLAGKTRCMAWRYRG